MKTRDALLRDVESRSAVSADLEQLDFIVFSGDVAWQGEPLEYETVANELIDPLLQVAGLARDRIFFVPGNHDVRRATWANVHVEGLRDLKNADDVDERLTDPDASTISFLAQRPYREFTSAYMGDIAAPTVGYGYSRVLNIRDQTVTIIGLNTSWTSGLNKNSSGVVDDQGHLILGEPAVQRLLGAAHNDGLVIGVMHHPFSWLREFDGPKVKQQLTRACDFILRGHEHIADVEIRRGRRGGECTVIPAGASYDRSSWDYWNGYNYVCVEDVAERTGCVFLRHWDPGDGEWVADHGAGPSGRFSLSEARDSAGDRSTLGARRAATTRLCNVPRFGRIFAGRETVLADVQRSLAAHRTVAVTGLGGVGKTRVAAEYARRFGARYDVIWWVRAEAGATRVRDLADLGRALELPATERDDAAAQAAALRWLRANDRWLVIFDGASDRRALLPDLPGTDAGGHVLVTSVAQPGWSFVGHEIPLPVWTSGDSATFLERRFAAGASSDLEDLATALGHLPLALEQACGYMSATGLDASDYLDRLRLGAPQLFDLAQPPDYAYTVATTWRLALEGLETEPAAVELLNCAAFLASTDIPRGLFSGPGTHSRAFTSLDGTPGCVDRAIAALRNYSLVDVEGDALSVHRLVQRIVRERCARAPGPQWAAAAVRTLVEQFPEQSRDPANWASAARLAPHASAAARHAADAKLLSKPLADLAARVAWYFQSRGMAGQAIEMWEIAVRATESSRDRRLAAKRRYGWGQCLVRAGQTHEGLAKLRQAHRELAATGYGSHDEIAALGLVGAALRLAGEPHAAEKDLSRALTRLKRHPSTNLEDVAITTANLGLALRDLRELDRARAVFAEAAALFQDLRGPTDPDVARLLIHEGETLLLKGLPQEAEVQLRNGVSMFEASTGSEHPDAAQGLAILAHALALNGDCSTARSMAADALASLEQTCGETDRRIADAAYRLGAVLALSGEASASRNLVDARQRLLRTGMSDTHADIGDVDRLLQQLHEAA